MKTIMKIGSVYTNSEICAEFKCSLMGGMNRSKSTNTLVLIARHDNQLYEDRWDGSVMYYTGMGKEGNQVLEGNQNKTLYESDTNGVSVHLFEVFKQKQYIYLGNVSLNSAPFQESQKDVNKEDRTVWVFPIKMDGDAIVPIDEKTLIESFDNKLTRLANVNDDELMRRVKDAPKKPGKRSAVSTTFQRNVNVIELALRRANGICELCEEDAPFKKNNGKPFLEVHHIKWLAKGGDDSIDNAVSLCPNCHRKMHALNIQTDVEKLKLVAAPSKRFN